MFTLCGVLLSVALLSPFVFGVPLDENSISDELDGDRIWGGQEAAIGQFPHQISMLFAPIGASYRHRCGGSILTNRFVLTAGHCHDKKFPELIHYRIVVGAHVKNSKDGATHNIKRWIVHEGFYRKAFDDSTMRNDIALIETNTTIQFNELVAPIALHPKFIKDGHETVASGWGDTNDENRNLKFVKLTTLTNPDCIKRYAENSKVSVPVYHETLCAYSGQKEHGICTGDSGGPLVFENKLIGLTSWSLRKWGNCALGVPDGFTRMSPYINWINEKIRTSP